MSDKNKRNWEENQKAQRQAAGVGIVAEFGVFRKDVARNPRGVENKPAVGG
jgi:hypothetical protein